MKHSMKLVSTLALLAVPFLLVGLTNAPDATEAPVEPVTDQRTLLIQLAVADLDRSVRFYRDVLGLEIESVSEALKWARRREPCS